MTKPDQTRLPALDSLRGLAALAVVFTMCCGCTARIPLCALLGKPELAYLRSWVAELPGTFLIELAPAPAHQRSRSRDPLLSDQRLRPVSDDERRAGDHPYRDFLVRRICRIYIPYLAGLAFAIALSQPCRRASDRDERLDQPHVAMPVDCGAVLSHVALVGNFNTDLFLMPSWTLVHEMRLSFVFPLLPAGAVAQPLAAGGHRRAVVVRHRALRSVRRPLRHLVPHRPLRRAVSRRRVAGARTRPLRRVLGVARCAAPRVAAGGRARAVQLRPLYSGSFTCRHRRRSADRRRRRVPHRLGDEPPAGAGLAPIRWLGRVSYGMYLLAIFRRLASIYLLRGLLPLWTILILAVAMTFAAAELFDRIVEGPAIRLGRRLTSPSPGRRRMSGRAPPTRPSCLPFMGAATR